MNNEVLELKDKILKATTDVYRNKGMKFTMDDIAGELHISKKTIYKIFKDKEDLLLEMATRCFDDLKTFQNKVYNDDELGDFEKLKMLLSAIPNQYENVDFAMLYELKDKYPYVYNEVQRRLETGWEMTKDIIDRGISEGILRNDFSYPIFKIMFTSTIENFFKEDVLTRNSMTYQEGLINVVDIMLRGISKGEIK